MANPQHLEWLKEGVASWNRRRHDLVFFPDLADANLQGAILHGADLREADLQRANLKEANLTMADLREADLREADLLDANLTMADLREADVRTLKDPGTSKIVSGAANYTNLSRCRKLTQAQLGRMLGDSGTILPDHLTRPEHWSDLDPETTTTTNENNKIAQPPEPETSNPEPNTGTATLNARVIFHLRHARTASLTAETVAQLLDAEVTVQRQTTNQIGPEIDLLEELVETLRGFSTATSASNPVPSDLERQLEEAKRQIEDLTAKLADTEAKAKTPSEFTKAFQTSAGKALGTAIVAAPLGAITGGLAYLLGAGAQASIIGFGMAAATAGIGALK